MSSDLQCQGSEKPIRCSVAVVVRRPGEESFLIVRRPLDDDRLPGVWGLPAVTLREGELPESAARRVGMEKLGCSIEPERFLGIRAADRGEYLLILMDIEAALRQGEPDVERAQTTATRYIAQEWTGDLDRLLEGAERGSLCCQIMLDSRRGSDRGSAPGARCEP